MSEAERIYNALLRAERRLEPPAGTVLFTPESAARQGAFLALRTLREEIGRDIAKEGR